MKKTQLPWKQEEIEVMNKFFSSTMTEMNLFQRIVALNPARTFKSIQRRLEDMRASGMEKMRDKAIKSLRVGYLDIEATQLNGSFGYMLSWYIKEGGKNHYDSGVIRKQEILGLTLDRRITEELLVAMGKYDVLYAHYGSDYRFDLPFIRTRAYKWGLEELLPKQNTLYIMDTYPIAKQKLKLYSNRLGVIAAHLGIHEKKTPLDTDMWVKAALGDQKSLDYIVLHNKRDVQILEKVHKRLKAVERPIYRSV
jgi:uncharacterized protein YprB with RNaseH-like and TPR domain